MLNTYRGWESAELRKNEASLPENSDKWFADNSVFSFVTASQIQIKLLQKKGFYVNVVGKGEDDSYLLCISQIYKISGSNLLHNFTVISLIKLRRLLLRIIRKISNNNFNI